MSTNGLELLLPCPFCGGGVTEFRDNGQVWVGTKYSEPTSVSVRHWCEELPGPSRMIERIGRDKEQAIERWNMRAQTAPSVPDGWREFLTDFTQRVSEAGDHTDWSFHREMVRLSHRAHQMLRLQQSAQTAPSVPAPIEGAKYMSNDWYYAEGWNDCRHAMLDAQTAPSVQDGWQPIETAPKDGTHVLLANKTGTRVADGMYGNYKVWSWPYVLVEPAYWRPMPAAPGAQENNDV